MPKSPGEPFVEDHARHVSLASSARWRVVSRLVSRDRKAATHVALRAGNARELERVDLLAPDRLNSLAVQGMWLLVGSGAVFAGLDIAARIARHAGPLLGSGSPWLRALALFVANVAGYALVLPLHEGVHALVILALGGRPRFGLKLPLAAYCTAPDQLFTRNGYLVIALAPLAVLSVAGAVLTWAVPDAGACVLLGLAGNVSGAVADLATAARLRRLPADALILDTETGFVALVPQQVTSG